MEDARLPTEQEKVQFFELLGIDRRRIPHRVYQGAVGKQTHYFALKLPIAVDTKTATFAYVDPGKYTDTELRSWGVTHGWLWRALRGKGPHFSPGGVIMAPEFFPQRVLASEERSGDYGRASMGALRGKGQARARPVCTQKTPNKAPQDVKDKHFSTLCSVS